MVATLVWAAQKASVLVVAQLVTLKAYPAVLAIKIQPIMARTLVFIVFLKTEI